ncbi:MAG: hypothetical protein PHS95_03125 [Candidatus Pacebacteria bacterium]|nr:hypothetical protein [Candidatus Paceibacterota bacterium]
MASSWLDGAREQRARELNLPTNSSWSEIREIEKKLYQKEKTARDHIAEVNKKRINDRKSEQKARKKRMAKLCGLNGNVKWGEKLRKACEEEFKKKLADLAEGLGLPREATEKEVNEKLRMAGSIYTAKGFLDDKRRGPNG